MKKFEKRKNIKENLNLDAKKATNDNSLEQVSGGVAPQSSSNSRLQKPTMPPLTDEDIARINETIVL